ncbi:hypothetical protein GQ53DRAFT_877150 [Thozetella sp. PMI_491]|nr:hypothetical protein GQ53DRAFT_877150 [Thozetella sp. PMI_491]
MTGTSFFAPWSPPFSGPPSFNQRSFTKCSQAVLVSLAMQILRSYPHMIVQKGMLPPFISPIQYSWTETGQGPPQQASLPSPSARLRALINCISLVQMFRSRTETNKIFVWRLIKLEQERILEEHNELDQWELLASLQALLIYSLLRLQDTPTSPDVFDFSLLATVSMVATRLALSVGCADCNLPQNADEAWSEWIFIECRRRTVLIFQIINMLVEMSTAISYYTADLGGFALVPLASSAGLFNAQDIECWRTEFELRYKRYTVYGISQAGLLTKLQHNGTECRTSTEDWAEWSADVGAIGNLVMIVGSLLSDRYRSLTPSELMAIPSSILGFAAPSRMDTTFPAGAALG